ncbi:hypothetical protein BD769DRAFT_1399904 [Suillus cothurnatus]|nr:hypothetical protein BD769DRAFT_1399904 [Suillus cothurnatus]
MLAMQGGLTPQCSFPMLLHLCQLHGMFMWQIISPRIVRRLMLPIPSIQVILFTPNTKLGPTRILEYKNIPNLRPWNDDLSRLVYKGGACVPLLQGVVGKHHAYKDAGTNCYSSHLPRNGLDKYGSLANTFPGLLTSGLTPVQEDPNAGEEGVTCLNVLATLHAALQRPLTDTEWGTAGDDKRASLIRAQFCRMRRVDGETCTWRSWTKLEARAARAASAPRRLAWISCCARRAYQG